MIMGFPLTLLQEAMINERDCAEPAPRLVKLDRGFKRRWPDEFCHLVLKANQQLTTRAEKIMPSSSDLATNPSIADKREIPDQSRRNAVSWFFRANSDKETVVTWELDLDRVYHTFDTRLVLFMVITQGLSPRLNW